MIKDELKKLEITYKDIAELAENRDSFMIYESTISNALSESKIAHVEQIIREYPFKNVRELWRVCTDKGYTGIGRDVVRLVKFQSSLIVYIRGLAEEMLNERKVELVKSLS